MKTQLAALACSLIMMMTAMAVPIDMSAYGARDDGFDGSGAPTPSANGPLPSYPKTPNSQYQSDFAQYQFDNDQYQSDGDQYQEWLEHGSNRDDQQYIKSRYVRLEPTYWMSSPASLQRSHSGKTV